MSHAPPAAGQTPKPKRRGPIFGWAVAALLGFALGFATGIQVCLYVIANSQSVMRDNLIAGPVQDIDGGDSSQERPGDTAGN